MPRSFRWAGIALGLLVCVPASAEALDWAVSWIRGSRPKIMQLHPRE